MADYFDAAKNKWICNEEEWRPQTVDELLPKYTAQIIIGSLVINLTDKTFTSAQIEHMREYFGWEVKNLCE